MSFPNLSQARTDGTYVYLPTSVDIADKVYVNVLRQTNIGTFLTQSGKLISQEDFNSLAEFHQKTDYELLITVATRIKGFDLALFVSMWDNSVKAPLKFMDTLLNSIIKFEGSHYSVSKIETHRAYDGEGYFKDSIVLILGPKLLPKPNQYVYTVRYSDPLVKDRT